MQQKIILGIAALVLGTACATAPAFAKKDKQIVIHPLSYSNTGPWQAPLSPNGAGASAFGGPGYNGPYGQPSAHVASVTYSNTGPWNAPLSPNGAGAGASAFGGPGYNGPYEQPQAHGTLMAYSPNGVGAAGSHGQPARNAAPTYSNTGPWQAPLSPNGAGAGASAFGGPGFNGPY